MNTFAESFAESQPHGEKSPGLEQGARTGHYRIHSTEWSWLAQVGSTSSAHKRQDKYCRSQLYGNHSPNLAASLAMFRQASTL